MKKKKEHSNSWAPLGINTLIQIKTPSALRIKPSKTSPDSYKVRGMCGGVGVWGLGVFIMNRTVLLKYNRRKTGSSEKHWVKGRISFLEYETSFQFQIHFKLKVF